MKRQIRICGNIVAVTDAMVMIQSCSLRFVMTIAATAVYHFRQRDHSVTNEAKKVHWRIHHGILVNDPFSAMTPNFY